MTTVQILPVTLVTLLAITPVPLSVAYIMLFKHNPRGRYLSAGICWFTMIIHAAFSLIFFLYISDKDAASATLSELILRNIRYNTAYHLLLCAYAIMRFIVVICYAATNELWIREEEDSAAT